MIVPNRLTAIVEALRSAGAAPGSADNVVAALRIYEWTP
jgi:hypothetical protein